MTTDPTKTPEAPAQGEGLAAFFANTAYVTVTQQSTRIVFGEIVPFGINAMNPRVAVAMPTGDAVALARIILDTYDQHLKNLAAMAVANGKK
jgi:hypothetical protein